MTAKAREETRVELTPEYAKEQMLAWGSTLSHANFFRSLGAGHVGPAEIAATESALTVADAAEVQKWAAIYVALLEEQRYEAQARLQATQENQD